MLVQISKVLVVFQTNTINMRSEIHMIPIKSIFVCKLLDIVSILLFLSLLMAPCEFYKRMINTNNSIT